MNLYWDSCVTMYARCSLNLLTIEKIDNSGSEIPAFTYAFIVMRAFTIAMVVPVLPIPA